MSFNDAKSMLLRGVVFGDVFGLVSEGDQDSLREWYCTTPGLPNLAARTESLTQPRSVPSGDMCVRCGGHMVRTGMCMTCSSCGESSGGCG